MKGTPTLPHSRHPAHAALAPNRLEVRPRGRACQAAAGHKLDSREQAACMASPAGDASAGVVQHRQPTCQAAVEQPRHQATDLAATTCCHQSGSQVPWWLHACSTASLIVITTTTMWAAPVPWQSRAHAVEWPQHNHMLVTNQQSDRSSGSRRLSIPSDTARVQARDMPLSPDAMSAAGGELPVDSPPQLVAGVASEAEDKLLEAVRQIEARVDSAVGAVVTSGPRLPFTTTSSLTEEEQAHIQDVAQKLVNEVWEVVDQNYLDARSTGWDRDKWRQLRDQALTKTYTDVPSMYRSIKEMLAWGLSDPYCRFITPTELSAMKKYDVTGIGLNLGTSEEYILKTGRSLPLNRPPDSTGVFVVGLSKGSPSDKVGIKQGDELLEVDGTPLDALSPFQAASLIAGHSSEEGVTGSQSSVQLKVRGGDGLTYAVAVDRPVRLLTSPVKASLVKGSSETVGVLRLSSFNARAQRDLAAAIDQLQQQGAKSLVLDLRDNRGGLVSEGLEVARLFLEDNAPIVFTESRNIPKEVPRATGQPLTSLPLMVIVNEHTASASEIVAGALHDNCRAVLVGSRTYGKGLIQSVYELSDGSGIVLTVGKYLTPKRTDIDRSGIMPDFSSRPSPRLAAETLDACRLSNNLASTAPATAAGPSSSSQA